jgi:hypothetical protein
VWGRGCLVRLMLGPMRGISHLPHLRSGLKAGNSKNPAVPLSMLTLLTHTHHNTTTPPLYHNHSQVSADLAHLDPQSLSKSPNVCLHFTNHSKPIRTTIQKERRSFSHITPLSSSTIFQKRRYDRHHNWRAPAEWDVQSCFTQPIPCQRTKPAQAQPQASQEPVAASRWDSFRLSHKSHGESSIQEA